MIYPVPLLLCWIDFAFDRVAFEGASKLIGKKINILWPIVKWLISSRINRCFLIPLNCSKSCNANCFIEVNSHTNWPSFPLFKRFARNNGKNEVKSIPLVSSTATGKKVATQWTKAIWNGNKCVSSNTKPNITCVAKLKTRMFELVLLFYVASGYNFNNLAWPNAKDIFHDKKLAQFNCARQAAIFVVWLFNLGVNLRTFMWQKMSNKFI